LLTFLFFFPCFIKSLKWRSLEEEEQQQQQNPHLPEMAKSLRSKVKRAVRAERR